MVLAVTAAAVILPLPNSITSHEHHTLLHAQHRPSTQTKPTVEKTKI